MVSRSPDRAATVCVAQRAFHAADQDTIVLDVPEPDKILHPGKNKVRIEMTGKNTFPYTLAWSYNTLKPSSSENLPVKLNAQLDRKSSVEGEPVRLSVTVENTQDKGQGMAVAIVGLPAGLSLPEDMKQLKDYARLRNNGTEKGLISAWETRGRELILYWRDLAPRQKIEVPVHLVSRVPGEYRGPASRAYLYYNADHKHWIEPLEITIKARGE
jgi:alpha-2-macroglobulin-like protein